MANMIQRLSYQQKHSKIMSQNGITTHTYEDTKINKEILKPTILTLPSDLDDLSPVVKSNFRHPDQERTESSILQRRKINQSIVLPHPNSSKYKEVKRKKKRSNRDSIFSFVSIISKNDEWRSTDRIDSQKKEDVSSPVYSQISFLSSSSSLDIPIQQQPRKICKSPCKLPIKRFSMLQPRSPLSPPCKTSKSARFSIHNENSLEQKTSPIHSEQYKSSSKLQNLNDSVLEFDNHLNYFQEQQEQEYEIAKAWLEAVESRTPMSPTTRGAMVSGSVEGEWDDSWINTPSLEKTQTASISKIKESHNDYDMNHGCSYRKETNDKVNEDVRVNETNSAQYGTTSKIFSDKAQKNSKYKRISGMAGFAVGVRGWLNRRVRSN